MVVDRLRYGNNIACHLVIAVGSITVHKALMVYHSHIIHRSQVFRINLEVSNCYRAATDDRLIGLTNLIRNKVKIP